MLFYFKLDKYNSINSFNSFYYILILPIQALYKFNLFCLKTSYLIYSQIVFVIVFEFQNLQDLIYFIHFSHDRAS